MDRYKGIPLFSIPNNEKDYIDFFLTIFYPYGDDSSYVHLAIFGVN